jgi:hypothetical protein
MEEEAIVVVEASSEFVGRWNRLVSTTNWEKGRIIFEWREALRQAGASAASSTDDAWSRQVGGVTPQHVGRLRRTFDRFGGVFDQYAGLYWSHFHAALDWPDAEMYLEGALQNDWSVSQMRDQRWEALGGTPEERPSEADVLASPSDEDDVVDDNSVSPTISESLGEVRRCEPDFSDESDDGDSSDPSDRSELSDPSNLPTADPAPAPIRPFEALPPLPADLNEAFELMKLAILAHKVSGWREIARNDVLSVLESLRQLALAPAG